MKNFQRPKTPKILTRSPVSPVMTSITARLGTCSASINSIGFDENYCLVFKDRTDWSAFGRRRNPRRDSFALWSGRSQRQPRRASSDGMFALSGKPRAISASEAGRQGGYPAGRLRPPLRGSPREPTAISEPSWRAQAVFEAAATGAPQSGQSFHNGGIVVHDPLRAAWLGGGPPRSPCCAARPPTWLASGCGSGGMWVRRPRS